MKAFVTGPTGFLGINLLQHLAKEGWDIIAFHRPTSDLSEVKKIARVGYAIGDVRDLDSLLRGLPVDVAAGLGVASVAYNAALAAGPTTPHRHARAGAAIQSSEMDDAMSERLNRRCFKARRRWGGDRGVSRSGRTSRRRTRYHAP